MENALYQVAVKLLLTQNDKILVLKSPDGKVDFPGGRISNEEISLPQEISLAREVDEELGGDVRYSEPKLLFTSLRTYTTDTLHHVLALFFTAEYRAGDIVLSDEHSSFEWINPVELEKSPESFVSENEYSQYAKHLKYL